jgi:hypothetical protein
MSQVVISNGFVDHEGVNDKDMLGIVEASNYASNELFGDIHGDSGSGRDGERWWLKVTVDAMGESVIRFVDGFRMYSRVLARCI